MSLIENNDYVIDSNIQMWGGEAFAQRAVPWAKRI